LKTYEELKKYILEQSIIHSKCDEEYAYEKIEENVVKSILEYGLSEKFQLENVSALSYIDIIEQLDKLYEDNALPNQTRSLYKVMKDSFWDA